MHSYLGSADAERRAGVLRGEVKSCQRVHPLTFDLEDWRPLADEMIHGVRTGPSGRLRFQVDGIRRLLDRRHVRATFFCLGSCVETEPDLVKTLLQDGHEIASHGYSHVPVHRLSPERFEEDLIRAQNILTDAAAGQVPRGYRAPMFSVSRATWWVFDILTKHGFVYDSSIFPMRLRRYGVKNFGRGVQKIKTRFGSIVELPLATVSRFWMRLPVAGGGYFRVMPRWLLRWGMSQVFREGLSFTTYFHPYEYDPIPLRLSIPGKSWHDSLRCRLFTAHQNLGRASMPRKLEAMLEKARFGRCIDCVSAYKE